MNEKRHTLAIKGMLAGVINQILKIVLPFATRTIIIYTIGIQYIGLNSVFASILSILSFAELGFGRVMVYSMYKPIAEKDNEKLCALLNLYRNLYRVIGCIILTIGLAIAPFLRNFIHGSYPSDVNLYILYGIYLFNAVIGYWLFAYKSSLLSAHQLYYVSTNINSTVEILIKVYEIVVLLAFKNFYVYVIALPAGTIINNLFVAYQTKKLFPHILPRGIVDRETTKSIRKNVLAGIGHRLGPTATTSIDNLVVSSMAGLVMASVYSNYNYIVATASGFIALFLNSYVAGIGNSLITETKEKNYNDFLFFTFVNSFLVGISTVCILCLCQPFMWLWIGQRNGKEYMYSVLSLILLCLMFYTQGIRSTVQAYKTAAGMWYADRWKPYVSTIFNALLDISLFPSLGINGILLSTVLSRALIGIPWETRAFFKEYFQKSEKEYYVNIYEYAIITCIIGSTCYFFSSLLSETGIIWLGAKAIICVCLALMLYILAYRKNVHMIRLKSAIFTAFTGRINTR